VSGEAPERGSDPAAAHDDTGLDLARSLARSMSRRAGGDSDRRTDGTSGDTTRRRRRSGDAQASGAHPDQRDPQPLGETIDRLVDERGWATDVAVHGVFGKWERIVGPQVAQHCRPESYADGRLTVRAESTAWATQMKLLAPTVIRRLNEELGDGTVLRVDVLGPHLPTWSKGGRALRDGRGPRDTYG
jgi:predicted nucleic acid-binding Zn ribbon protein